MKHLFNTFIIILIVSAMIYIFKDELFYSPKKIKEKPTEVSFKENKSTKLKNENKTKVTKEKNQKIELKPVKKEKSIVERLTLKAYVLDIKYDKNKIMGEIKSKSRILKFETKYDPDVLALLEDSKNYKIQLTFVIQKVGNKAYIEEIK